MAAVEQINRGSHLQASATQETSAALVQIEKSAKLAQTNTGRASDRVADLEVGAQGEPQIRRAADDRCGRRFEG